MRSRARAAAFRLWCALLVCSSAGLLLARLLAESSDDVVPMHAAAFVDEGRVAALYGSDGSVLARALRRPAEELTHVHARSYACWRAWTAPSMVRGATALWAATGLSDMRHIELSNSQPMLHKCDSSVVLAACII